MEHNMEHEMEAAFIKVFTSRGNGELIHFVAPDEFPIALLK